MSGLIQAISDYGAAWREADFDKRKALLARCFAETGRYVDPTAEVSGRAQLCTHIGEVLDRSGGRVEITSAPVSHHDVVYFTWHMVNADGAIMVAGHDFARLNVSGQIVHLAGFFGDPLPLN